MKKYILVAKNMWVEILTYRFNFVMWRARNFVQLIGGYFLWLALLAQNKTMFGYSEGTLLTYLLGAYFLNAIVFSTRTNRIGDEINQGDLVNYLVKPVNYFAYYIAKDIGDKAMNITFSLVEVTLLFLLLKPPFFIQTDISYLILFFVAVLIAIVINFLFGMMLGFIGFWSNEVWGPWFIFGIVVNFFSGGYFPLDMLPKPFFLVFQALPFQYLLYFPLKIYLGQLPLSQVLLEMSIALVWIFALYILANKIWLKGLRTYTAYGK